MWILVKCDEYLSYQEKKAENFEIYAQIQFYFSYLKGLQ